MTQPDHAPSALGRRRVRRAITAALLAGAAGLLAACGGSAATGGDGATVIDGAAAPAPADLPESRQKGDREWRQAVAHSADMHAMSAYADASSVAPGDRVHVFATTTSPTFRITAYRMGYYRGAGGKQVWQSDDQPGREQTALGYDQTLHMPYARWDASAEVSTDGWDPGMYLLRLQAASGAQTLLPLVVRSPDVSGQLVFVMPDDTWQAYNEWGGRSAYKGPMGFGDRSYAVSFSRPYAYGAGAGKYLAEEQPAVALAAQHDLPVSYVTATDLDSGRVDLAGAEGVVTLGHDEYWTTTRRAAVTKARDAGTDLGFLGANTMYWRVRLEDGPQDLPKITIYKSAADDPVQGPTTTARFRDPPDPEAERSLIGMDYECYPARGSYTITDPAFFLFAGTGVHAGSTFPRIDEIEVDRAYPLPGIPKDLQIVTNSPTDCGGAQSVTNSTYYSTTSGAGVFATGTIGWVVRGLRHFPAGSANYVPPSSQAFVRTVTLNLWTAMLAGPMGQAHPSKGNIDQFQLSPTNTTGKA